MAKRVNKRSKAVTTKSRKAGELTRSATIGSAQAIGSFAGSMFASLKTAGSEFATGFKAKQKS
jgi:hypothetical protein